MFNNLSSQRLTFERNHWLTVQKRGRGTFILFYTLVPGSVILSASTLLFHWMHVAYTQGSIISLLAGPVVPLASFGVAYLIASLMWRRGIRLTTGEPRPIA